MQEDYIKEEQRNLKRELLRAQEEVRRIQSVPLVIGQFLEMVDNSNGIVGSTTGKALFMLHGEASRGSQGLPTLIYFTHEMSTKATSIWLQVHCSVHFGGELLAA